MEELQDVAFKIIAKVGEAKTVTLDALVLAKKGQFDKADELFEVAKQSYAKAHDYHFDMIQKEANGASIPYSILFSHAEDQLLAFENMSLFCIETAAIYRVLAERLGGNIL